MTASLTEFLPIMAVAVIAAFGIIALLRWCGSGLPALVTGSDDDQVLIFHDGKLHDATPAALALFGKAPSDLAEAETQAAHWFPDISLTGLLDGECRTVRGHGGQAFATISRKGQAIRLGLRGRMMQITQQAGPAPALLDQIAAHAPQLIWQQDQTQDVIWANAAFKRLSAEAQQPEILFDLPDALSGTVRLQPQGIATRWFDIDVAEHDGLLTCFATEVTALMRADRDRRDFVQTLGKTFADLATGLAIFDKDRTLTMFNPALTEMTRLPVIFLSARPRIDTVLDRLRELQKMPEPKNYATWREQFTAVEAGAKNGTYCETWSLPDGQTFRVTGRPHPDGAFALLFEDISAEVSLTRRFRSEIELGQTVLDTLDDAIAVFSSAGTLLMSNRAYAELWSDDPTDSFRTRDLRTETALWQQRGRDMDDWDRLAALVHTAQPGQTLPDAMLADGRRVTCAITPLHKAYVMVRFSIAAAQRPTLQHLPLPDAALRAQNG